LNIVKATRRFEAWLGQQTSLVKPDLRYKHECMAEAAFPFLRATFYHWMQLWPEVCPELNRAPRVLAVGDLHVENFGTWRDAEGRLVWGINDFDEAARLPYTHDLVRLAASALLAIEEGHIGLSAKIACTAILEGYAKSLAEGGRPFVLEEEHQWLRAIATGKLRNPARFWEKTGKWHRVRHAVPADAREALERALPEPGLKYELLTRVSGLGSLGRMRFIALASHHGGQIAREAKALVPSSVYWARGKVDVRENHYQTLLNHAVRSRDPFAQLSGRWVTRRLSPHCCRVELEDLPGDRDELRLLHAMGWETANIHLASPPVARNIRKHIRALKPKWLLSAAKDTAKAISDSWRVWRKKHR